MRHHHGVKKLMTIAISAATSVALAGSPSFGLTFAGDVNLGGISAIGSGGVSPAPVPSVRVSPAPLPNLTPPDFNLFDGCATKQGSIRESQIRPLCLGRTPRVDETYTIYTNTVL